MSTDINPSPEIRPESPGKRPKLNWVLLFALLLGPILVTALSAQVGGRGSGFAPAVAFVGGVSSGIAIGILLGRHLGQSPGAKVGWSIALSLVLTIVCLTMNTFGCLAGGYQLDFR